MRLGYLTLVGLLRIHIPFGEDDSMQRTLLGGKIHRATVTQADLHYVGSITIDVALLEAAGLVEGEQVQVVDIDTGARLTTYVIEGAR